MRGLIVISLVAALGAGAAVARGPLKEFDPVKTGLIEIGIADAIRKKCDTISPRIWRAYNRLETLKSLAEAAGYSEEEIKAYVKDKAEKKRLLGIADRYMAERGVTKGDGESYCRLGVAEIAKDSQIGRLLRAK